MGTVKLWQFTPVLGKPSYLIPGFTHFCHLFFYCSIHFRMYLILSSFSIVQFIPELTQSYHLFLLFFSKLYRIWATCWVWCWHKTFLLWCPWAQPCFFCLCFWGFCPLTREAAGPAQNLPLVDSNNLLQSGAIISHWTTVPSMSPTWGSDTQTKQIKMRSPWTSCVCWRHLIDWLPCNFRDIFQIFHCQGEITFWLHVLCATDLSP